MSTGTSLMRRIINRVGRLPFVRLFRNNVGMGWVGQVTRRRDGSILIRNPRPLHAGLIRGSGDHIGWTEYVVRLEDVGRTLAIFTSVEAKDGSGELEEDQRRWRDNVRAAGGIAIEARSPEQAEEEIRRFRDGRHT